MCSHVRACRAGKQLRVHSLTTNKKKCLNENCAGHFSTAPDKLCMYLYEINQTLSDTFPCKVRGRGRGRGGYYVALILQALVSFSNSSDSVLSDLQGAVVILKKSITETSVIATR